MCVAGVSITKLILSTCLLLSQILDLVILDIDSLQYTYSVLAASALYHVTTREVALESTGKNSSPFKYSNLITSIDYFDSPALKHSFISMQNEG